MAISMDALLKIKADVQGIGPVQTLATKLGVLQDAATRVEGGFKGLAGAAGGLVGGLQTLLPLVSGAGLVALGKSAIDSADNMNDLSQKTGVSVESLSQFGQAAEKSGTDINGVGNAMTKLNKGLGATGKAGEGVRDALKAIGISATDANGKLKPTDQIMLEVADKFAKMPDGANKSAIAMQLFGKSGADMIPLLNGGAQSIKDLAVTMTGEFAAGADQFNDKMVDLQTKVTQLGVEVGTALMPVLSDLTDGLMALLDRFNALPEPVRTAIEVIAGIVIVLKPVVSLINGIKAALVLLGPSVIGAFQGILSWIAGTFIPGLIAFFGALSPVGWVVIAIAGITLLVIAFREQLGNFLKWLWEWGAPIRQFWVDLWGKVQALAVEAFTTLMQLAYKIWVEPWANLWNNVLKEPARQLWSWLHDQASNALTGLQNIWGGIAAWWQTKVVIPLKDAWSSVSEFIPNALRTAADAVRNVFSTAINAVKSGFRAVLQMIANQINIVAGLVNRLIAAFNKLPGPDIPFIPTLTVPEFAKGGVVTGPTVALIGEGGEPEYVIPEGKAAGFAQNYLGGKRGAAAIPAFADGGYVKPSLVYKPGIGGRQPEVEVVGIMEAMAQATQKLWEEYLAKQRELDEKRIEDWRAANKAKAQQPASTVNVTTGPVIEFNDKRYVAIDDFNKAVSEVQQKIMREAQELLFDPFVSKWTGI